MIIFNDNPRFYEYDRTNAKFLILVKEFKKDVIELLFNNEFLKITLEDETEENYYNLTCVLNANKINYHKFEVLHWNGLPEFNKEKYEIILKKYNRKIFLKNVQ